MDKVLSIRMKYQGRKPLVSPSKQITQGPLLPNLVTSHLNMLATDRNETKCIPNKLRICLQLLKLAHFNILHHRQHSKEDKLNIKPLNSLGHNYLHSSFSSWFIYIFGDYLQNTLEILNLIIHSLDKKNIR